MPSAGMIMGPQTAFSMLAGAVFGEPSNAAADINNKLFGEATCSESLVQRYEGH